MDELDDFQKEQLFKIIKYGNIRKLTSFFKDIENTDIDFEDISGKTPLMCAVCYDDKDDIRTHMVRTLLRHGCDADKQDMYGCTALMYSCMDCGLLVMSVLGPLSYQLGRKPIIIGPVTLFIITFC
jgi:hypothetical protein